MKHRISNHTNLKGGEKMKYALVVLALMGLLLAGTANAETYTQTMYSGCNWFALNGVPLDPAPSSIFVGEEGLIDGALTRLDPTNGNTIPWFSWDDPATFGGMLLGDGFRLNVEDGVDHTISYEGAPDGLPDANGKTDMWISLPGFTGQEGGMHWIGTPYATPVLWSSILVTDGTKTVPVMDFDDTTEDAVSLGWIEPYWAYLDAASGNTCYVDPDGIFGDPNMLPGQLFEVITHKSNLALIIPAPAAE